MKYITTEKRVPASTFPRSQASFVHDVGPADEGLLLFGEAADAETAGVEKIPDSFIELKLLVVPPGQQRSGCPWRWRFGDSFASDMGYSADAARGGETFISVLGGVVEGGA